MLESVILVEICNYLRKQNPIRVLNLHKITTILEINKRKIINDPVYGFINIPSDLIFDLVQHPYFQRLRRIKQLGLTHLVYPGALHTRFHHSLGAMFLMQEALNVLKMKGQKISKEEEEGVLIAILLHDIGHGPFSHALEHSIIRYSSHENLSEIIMDRLNSIFRERLETGIKIFRHKHPKKFLSQLVSSQLDMDRLDYLSRDSFFTGVSEGIIGTQRIIKMLNVNAGNLVVDEKGIYSIEKYIIARRIMYWQVYLHKTVLSAENMLIKILERAKLLTASGEHLFATPAFSFFLENQQSSHEIFTNPDALENFT
ncbi:MAG: HD domain-containing protein, partial [Bacteroidales bacterium]|nr:HD domain-containing protein [Bacteroidales bacterium]